MTQGSSVSFRRLALAAAALLILAEAGPALAQADLKDARVEPWHEPNGTEAKPKTATSSPSATEPNAAEQRETRKLASAVFAKPGARPRKFGHRAWTGGRAEEAQHHPAAYADMQVERTAGQDGRTEPGYQIA